MNFVFCESPKIFGDRVFPCGKCRACRLTKANQKMIVSVYAANEYKKKGQFLTLTFNDKYKPDGLDHQIFSKFMKRLRRRDKTPDVKFFMAGEYGGDEDHTHREHFHVLFYNHKYSMDDVNAAWCDPKTKESFGFTYDGTLTPASMKYVSGYIDKKGYDPESGKRPPYGRSSCNIPTGMSDFEVERMCKTGKVQFNGRTFSAPEKFRRYYKDKWLEYEDERRYNRARKEYDENKKNFPDGMTIKQEEDAFNAHVLSVKARMDEHDRNVAVNKLEKQKKYLQKKLKRRIM